MWRRARKSDHGTICIRDRGTHRQRLMFFFAQKSGGIMPQNKFQKMIFAFITVVITVHAYVFYSLYVVNGQTLMALTGAGSVLGAIDRLGGVYMLGGNRPIWMVVVIEFILAYSLEIGMGSPCSFKLAMKNFDPQKTHPVLFETTIISATVALMCPAMSFLAAFLYYPFYAGFNVLTFLANWIRLVCFNFPFALLSQLFFIQPLVRTVFKAIFVSHPVTAYLRRS